MKTVMQLEQEIKEARIRKHEVIELQRKDIQTFITDFLSIHKVIEEGDEVISSDDSTEIRRPHPEVTYNKNIFNLYHRKGWSAEVPETTVNYYTGGATNDIWELKRLVSLGRLAEVLASKEFYDTLNMGVQKIKDIHDPAITREYENIRELEKTQKQIKIESERNKQEQFLQDLLKGVEFEEGVSFGNTTKTFNGVVNLKVEQYSASGKTADLQVKMLTWSGEPYELKVKKMKVDSFASLCLTKHSVLS